MKGETAYNERVEQEGFEQSQSVYFPEDSAEKKLFLKKQKLQKELREIENYEHRNDAEVDRQKKARLRKEVEAHQAEQRKINQAVDAQFSQMSHTDKSGKLIYGS